MFPSTSQHTFCSLLSISLSFSYSMSSSIDLSKDCSNDGAVILSLRGCHKLVDIEVEHLLLGRRMLDASLLCKELLNV